MVGVDADSAESAIRAVAARLLQLGYVRETFADAVLEREASFPTGLPTGDVPVAIPHADAAHCLLPAVAVAVLQRPVGFREMGNPDRLLEVRILFVLSVPDPSRQASYLQRLVDAFQRPGFLRALAGTADADAAYALCAEVLGGTGVPPP